MDRSEIGRHLGLLIKEKYSDKTVSKSKRKQIQQIRTLLVQVVGNGHPVRMDAL